MKILRGLLSSSIQLFWPARCAGCDVALPTDDAIFCDPCALGINPIGPACTGCALPRLGWAVGPPRARCAGCAGKDFAFAAAWAGFEYGESLAAAIMRMKHGGRPDVAGRLGRILAPTVGRAIDSTGGRPVDAILPVPLHPAKLRRRGFNQAVELARVVLARLRLTFAPGAILPALERRLLLRVKQTSELGRSGPSARRAEVSGAFAVADPTRVAGRCFLLLDDVMTTGATLHECAETLLRAGAAEVRVVALARAVA